MAACCPSGCGAPSSPSIRREAPGTIIIDTGNTALYYVLGQGRAIRYGVGVGREGFTWSGVQTISRKAEWPDWHPPAEMIARQPYLPRFMAGGPGNPLGARAMYLGSSEYRIHGTNDPSTIGKFVSSGCIRLTNEDVADLFSRVDVGTKVVVLPKNAPHLEARRDMMTRITAGRPLPAAPGGDEHARGPPGDEPFDIVAVLTDATCSGGEIRCSGDRAGRQRWAQLASVRAGAGARRARPKTFSPRCSARSAAAGRRCSPRSAAVRQRGRFRRCRQGEPAATHTTYGGGQAYCVRTCDGRYFPVNGVRQSEPGGLLQQLLPGEPRPRWSTAAISTMPPPRAESPIRELPNAFRYRNEIVAGCTCNGKDQIGLAPVKIEDDPTIRKGDIVAGADGLMVAGRSADKRGASLNFSPASKRIRARFARVRWWRRTDVVAVLIPPLRQQSGSPGTIRGSLFGTRRRLAR